MADKWYFAKGETKLGPYSSAQLKELADNGKILPSDTVWKEGIEKGVPAAKVRYLFSEPLAKVPASPAAKVASSPPSPAPPAKPTAEARKTSAETPAGSDSKEQAETDQPIWAEKMPDAPVAVDSESTGTAAKQKASAEASSPATVEAAAQKPETKKPLAQPAGTLPKSTRSFRVTGSRGAIILGADGTFVRYRKKCPKCGTEDSSVRTLQVRSGINRDRYFCQKCKKLQQVEIHGTL